MASGYVKTYRSLTEWEWYTDSNTKSLFIHCLLKANHTDRNYQGMLVERGSFLTGRKKLAQELGLSEQQIRTSIKRLKSTNEITTTSTNEGTLITVVKWGDYQVSEDNANQQNNQPTNQQLTNDQPATNQQLTTNKNDNNVNNDKNNIFTVWNEQKIVVHKKTKKIETKIKSKLDDYSEEEITRAIQNYQFILLSDEYFFNYKWTLIDFLDRGLEKFMDLEVAKNNYRSKSKATAPTNKQVRQPDIDETEKATDEERERLRAELQKLLKGDSV